MVCHPACCLLGLLQAQADYPYGCRLFFAVANTGADKAKEPWWKVFWLSVLAGAYLGLGVTFFLYVAGQLPSIEKSDPGLQHIVLGAFGLPMGLGLIIISGAELWTANCCYLSAAVFEVCRTCDGCPVSTFLMQYGLQLCLHFSSSNYTLKIHFWPHVCLSQYC